MAGTPEKILEHLLETVKLDSNGNDPIGGSSHTQIVIIFQGAQTTVTSCLFVVMFVSLQTPASVTSCSPIKSSCPPVSSALLSNINILRWFVQEDKPLYSTNRMISALCSMFYTLNHHCTYQAELSEGSEQEKDAYVFNAKQKVVRLIGQWVALYSFLLKEDPVTVDFLEVGLNSSEVNFSNNGIVHK